MEGNTVERAINELKKAQVVATRYDCEDVRVLLRAWPDSRYDWP